MMLRKMIMIGVALAMSAMVMVAAAEAEAEIEEHTISGAVIDATTEEGISGATVTISETGATATTDEYGFYSVEGVEAGSYTLTAEADGYESAEASADLNDGNATVDFSLSPSS